jgi:predicted dehydrogenase
LDYERWLGPAPAHPYCPARIHKNWRWVMDYGGGRIMDWTGHHLDIAHWGLGLDRTGPVAVEGTGVIPEKGSVWDAPPEYDCTATYEDGLEIRISSKYPMGAKWYGENGWIFVDRGTLEAESKSVLDEVIGEGEIHLYKSIDHFANFIECVKTRQETITPAEIAHRSASVGHLCNIALYTGRKIRWNPETEEIADDPGATAMLRPQYRAPWVLKG